MPRLAGKNWAGIKRGGGGARVTRDVGLARYSDTCQKLLINY